MLTRSREIITKPQWKSLSATKYFKLEQSTSQGQLVDDTNESPLTQILNSVVDHRNLYVLIPILNKQVEAVCDSGASVSCLREKLSHQINKNNQDKIQPSTSRLSSANQIPIQIKARASVPVKIGPKTSQPVLKNWVSF